MGTGWVMEVFFVEKVNVGKWEMDGVLRVSQMRM